MTSHTLVNSSNLIRENIIRAAFQCGESTHLGGALSMVDILSVLFGEVLEYNKSNPGDPDRDVFILSKGHCVLGYYATMNHFGLMTDKVFSTFQEDGSHLIAHPVKNLGLGIESSNGSLGQGLSFGLGMALGMRLDNRVDRSVFVLMGDGECNERSVWESAASAAEFYAENLIAIVDFNGFRNDGVNNTYTGAVNYKNIWQSFGWHVIEVDGHDCIALQEAFKEAKSMNSMPTVILARTIKGKGISFMEGNNDWHHNRITEKTYQKIIEEWKGV